MEVNNVVVNISVLVGLKNNLEYSKNFYSYFRKIYPNVEICFVSYGSTDGTDEWLLSTVKEDDNLRCFYSEEKASFSDTFNKAAQIATRKYIVFLHNDIVIAPNFLENIIKHLSETNVVSYTTVEPPLFTLHQRPGKIIRNFGEDFNNFNEKGFLNFVENEQKLNADVVSSGISFFMALNRATFLKIGGFDNLFSPMFCEDDDLIRRLSILGLKQITSLDSICYHFVSKTSRFSKEFETKSKSIELNSNKNYIRKWISRDLNGDTFRVGIKVKNCTLEAIQKLEPYFTVLLVDCEVEDYIKAEQPLTKFDLRKKFDKHSELVDDLDAMWTVDWNISSEIVKLLSFPLFLGAAKKIEPGKYDIEGAGVLEIREFKDRKEQLINLDSIYYSKLILHEEKS